MDLYLVDGHNLILTVRNLTEYLVFQNRRASRDETEALILAWAERQQNLAVRLIYDGQDFPDGHPGNRDEGPLSVRFADPPAEADDLIVFDAKEATLREGTVTVVSGDRELIRRVSEVGAKALSTVEFFKRLNEAPPAPPKEKRFTGEEREALDRQILDRGEGERVTAATAGPGAGDVAGRSRANTQAHAPSAPVKKKEPAVRARPDKSERRERFLAKQKRGGSAATGKSSKKKKKRGY